MVHILLILLLTSKAYAQGSDAVYARQIRQAQTPAELRSAQKYFQDLNAAKLACQRQIQKVQTPLACFEAVALETAWHLLPKKKRVRIIAQLDDLCAQTAHELRMPKNWTKNQYISPACRKSLSYAQKIRNYKNAPKIWSEN